MKSKSETRPIAGVPLGSLSLSVLAAAGALAFDLSVPPGIAGGVPYVALVLLALWSPWRHHVLIAAVAGSLLTMLGYFMSLDGGASSIAAFNRVLAIGIIWTAAFMVLHARKKAKDFRDSEVQLRIVVDNTDDGIIVVGRSGRIEMVNDAAAVMFGYRASELLDQPVSMLAHPNDRAKLERFLRRAPLDRSTTLGKDRTLYGFHKTGRAVSLDVSLAPLTLGGKQKFLATVRDNTERKEIERLNEMALVRAQEASMMKSAFLARMSHELRTPLNAIKLYSETLIEDAKESGQREMVSDLKRMLFSARQQMELIDNVLDLNRMEAGSVSLKINAFALNDLAEEITDLARPMVKKNDNRLIEPFPAILGTMTSDKVKIRQIMINIFSNAAKFTKAGEIRFGIDFFRAGDEDWIRFVVTDTGIGMSRAELDRIFDAFRQANSRTGTLFGGTGLGLTVAKQLSDMLGGRIRVDSAEGKGSTFTVELPRRCPDDAATDFPAANDRRIGAAGQVDGEPGGQGSRRKERTAGERGIIRKASGLTLAA